MGDKKKDEEKNKNMKDFLNELKDISQKEIETTKKILKQLNKDSPLIKAKLY